MSSPIFIYLAAEDDLSEVVLRRVLKQRDVRYEPLRFNAECGGSGFLKKNVRAFNNISRTRPVLLLTDLDRAECPASLVEAWFGRKMHHADFIFHVAVREVEAWLLADDSALCRFLKVRKKASFAFPEGESDPKATLLGLAANSPSRDISTGIVRRDKNGILQQGAVYNAELSLFVAEHWSVERAAEKCPSLRRLLRTLGTFERRRMA